MNNTCIDQLNTASFILDNGEESATIADSETGLKIGENSNLSMKDGRMCDDSRSRKNVREGGVNTSGDYPRRCSEEMGVARVQGNTSAGKGGLALLHGKNRRTEGEMTNESSEDRTTKNELNDQNVLSNSDHLLPNHANQRQKSEHNEVAAPEASKSNNDNHSSRQHQSLDGDCVREGHDITFTCSSSEDLAAIKCGNECPSNCDVHIKTTAHQTSALLSTVLNHKGNENLVGEGVRKEGWIKRTGDEISEGNVRTSVSLPGVSSANAAETPKFKDGCNCTSDVNGEEAENEQSARNQSESLPLEPECGARGSSIGEGATPVDTRPQHIPNLDAGGNHSPATIDITSSEEWEDANTDFPSRPLFFPENLTDLTPSPSSQQSSESTPSSSWSNQLSTPVGRASVNSEGVSEIGVLPFGKNPHVPSGVPDESNDTPRSRTSTATSLSTDFSSNVSIATDELDQAIADGLVLGEDEVGFEDVSLEHGEYAGHPPGASIVGSGAKPKKRGLGGFLSRNIFRKSLGKSGITAAGAESLPGWKLFGRVPAKETLQRDHMQISEDFQKRGQTHPPTSSLTWKKRHTGLKEASSTTALILENRPVNLPAKNPEEEEKHKEEYTKMLKEAKKKELKLYKLRLKKMAQQLKYEDGIKSSLHIWQQEILPRWDDVKKHKKTRDLWWQGVPPSVRGRVWMLAIKNELNITHELFEIFLIRAKDRIRMCSESESEGIGLEEIHAASRENSVDVIKLDVARTFPQLCIFQKGGPYFDLLHSVLGAYACYRPDVGYVQGMSFIAAVFLLYVEVADAFICFANLLNKSCQLAFFRLDQPVMQSYFSAFEEYFQDSLPRLYSHFEELGISPDLYIIDWMYTLYSKSLPLDVACRVWDVFFRDGEELLFRTALGILSLYENLLLNMDFIQAAQFLTNIPANIDSDKLFKHVDNIDMHQKRFGQVLIQHIAANLASQQGGGS